MQMRFEGKVRFFLAALRRFRQETPAAGTVVGDELNRRRFKRILYEAAIESFRSEILGGDAV